MAVHRTASGGTVEEGVLAFVEDKDSLRVLQEFCERNLLPVIELMKGGIQTAIKELAERTSPTRLIVDVSNSTQVERDIIHLTDLCDTETGLVLVGTHEGIDLYRELIGLGARDYLLKPLTIEALYNAFDERSAAMRGNRLVGVIGTSGGVGASTITAGLGWYLSEKSRRYTCIVDFDIQFGALALLFNRKPSTAIFSALRNPGRVDRTFIERSMDRVSERLVLLSGRVNDDEEEGRQAVKYRGLLQRIEPNFRYVICEAPRWQDRACQPLLERAQILVIVCAPDIMSFRNAVELYKIATEEGRGKMRIIVVLNRSGLYRQGEIGSEQFEQLTGAPIAHNIIFDQSMLQALNKGDIFASESVPFYRGIAQLSSDVVGDRVGESEKKGLFGMRMLGGT